MNAPQLAAELEVSRRTILRDVEALSSAGIPVYAIRGALGGFELLDGYTSDLPASTFDHGRVAAARTGQRARLRLSPRGRRLAALLGRPAGLRIRRSAHPVSGREDWTEAWIPIDSADAAVIDILALGAEAEVIDPQDLRDRVLEVATRMVRLHAGPPFPPDS